MRKIRSLVTLINLSMKKMRETPRMGTPRTFNKKFPQFLSDFNTLRNPGTGMSHKKIIAFVSLIKGMAPLWVSSLNREVFSKNFGWRCPLDKHRQPATRLSQENCKMAGDCLGENLFTAGSAHSQKDHPSMPLRNQTKKEKRTRRTSKK